MKNMKFTTIAAIPSWQLESPAKAEKTKPTPRGADFRINKQVSQLDTVPVGADVTVMCKGKLTMKRNEESSNGKERYEYEIEVMEVAVMKSQKDMMHETMQGT